MAKRVKIGKLLVTEGKYGKQVSIGLGKKGKDPKYNLSVEVIVRDGAGKIVAQQTDGYINLVDPRTLPAELLKASKISPEMAAKMTENASKLSDKVKYELEIPVKS